MRLGLTPFSLITALALGGCAGNQPASPAAPTSSTPAASSNPADELDQLSDEEVAMKLLEVTGSAKLGKLVMERMLEQFRAMPMVPGFLDKFKEKARPEELTEKVAELYLKHYDRPTMIAAIRFYRTEPGAALIAKLPVVTEERMQVGAEWGRKLATQTLEELGVPARP